MVVILGAKLHIFFGVARGWHTFFFAYGANIAKNVYFRKYEATYTHHNCHFIFITACFKSGVNG